MRILNMFCFRFYLIIVVLTSLSFGCMNSNVARKTVTIQGEVNRPGLFFIKKPTPFILLLLNARGYTENADASRVIVERDGKSAILDLSISKGQRPPHLAEIFKIYPDDTITVPKK